MRKTCLCIWLVLLVLELSASILAYWTLGWFAPVVFLCGTVFSNLVALAPATWRLWLGVALALCCGLPGIGYQAMLGIRWHVVSSEARRVVEWAKSEEQKTGAFPENSSSYVFRHPEYYDVVRYERWTDLEGVKWAVSYTVGTRSTYFSYSPEFGWVYHDD
jgi:hypothetical protein